MDSDLALSALLEEYRQMREEIRSAYRELWQLGVLFGALLVGGLTLGQTDQFAWALVAIPYVVLAALFLGLWHGHLSWVAAAHLQVVEKRVNEIIGETVLVWEHKIAPRLMAPSIIVLSDSENRTMRAFNPFVFGIASILVGSIVVFWFSGQVAHRLLTTYAFVAHSAAVALLFLALLWQLVHAGKSAHMVAETVATLQVCHRCKAHVPLLFLRDGEELCRSCSTVASQT